MRPHRAECALPDEGLGLLRASAGAVRRGLGTLTSAPATLGYAMLLFSIGAAARILRSLPMIRTVPALLASSPSSLVTKPWTIAASAFWLPGPLYYVAGIGIVIVLGVPLERRLGSLHFGAAMAATHAGGIMAAAALVWAMRPTMGSWPQVLSSDWYVGPTAALAGTAIAATSAMPVLWRRRVRVGALTMLLILALYQGTFADLVRLSAAAAGLLLGPLLSGRLPALRRPAVSRREARVLLALGVAACAVGPVAAGLLPHALGPLSVLRFLFTDIQPLDPLTLHRVCSSPLTSQQCQKMLLQLRAGAGGIFMAVLPCFLLLLCVDGLRRGRRFAWGLTLVILGCMAALAITHIAGVLWPKALGTAQNEKMDFQDLSHLHYTLALVLPLLLPVLLFLVTAGFRYLFTLPAPAGTYVTLGRTVAALAGALAAVYVVGGSALSAGFTPAPSLAQLIADVPDRFLPLGYTLDIEPAIFPETAPAILLYEGTGIVFWTLTGALILRSFLRPGGSGADAEQSRVRSILRAGAGDPLSWMTTWQGNRHWFAPEANGYVAYRVISGIALALGPPIGPPEGRRACLDGFVSFCNENGWTPCFYAAPPAFRAVTDPLGWGAIEVAQQTRIPLAALRFTGRRFQSVRSALNRAEKEGINARWLSYPTAQKKIRDQIDELAEEWIADHSLPELGFTLGGIAELQDPEVRCLVALDPDLVVQAVTSWLPVYHDGRIEGWTLDMMRRRRQSFPGSMEFLIGTAALGLRDEGYSYVSLSGVPLAPPQKDEDGRPPAVIGHFLDWFANRLEPSYGFRSLLAFKSKFAPEYEPLYLLYPDAAALPATVGAIASAYLGDIPLVRRLAVARQLLLHRAPAPQGQ